MVGQHFRLSVADLKSHRRARTVAFPRQLAMYLVRTVTEVSFPSIGDLFGGRDHSTVMHAVRTVEAKRALDPQTDALVSSIETELRSRLH
jgi:chromosomal replication initiator protein